MSNGIILNSSWHIGSAWMPSLAKCAIFGKAFGHSSPNPQFSHMTIIRMHVSSTPVLAGTILDFDAHCIPASGMYLLHNRH